MSSFLDLGDGRIQLPFGILGGVTAREYYNTGELKSVKLTERNVILTHAGELYPAYTETPRRKNKPSVKFLRSGLVNSVYLEEQQEVVTPIGSFPAELVTFYEDGALHRVFPLDGQISGFWSEEDEKELNIPLSFDLGFTAFTAMLNCICFFEDGNIKSITLYPGETVTVNMPSGAFRVRHGFSLYPSGALRSFEPEVPSKFETPIGTVVAFDPMSCGISADNGSVLLTEDGKPSSVSTAANHIAVQTDDGRLIWHKPVAVPHPCSDEKLAYKPLVISFDYENGTVTITDESAHVYKLSDAHFNVFPFKTEELGCTPADCASCSLCSG